MFNSFTLYQENTPLSSSSHENSFYESSNKSGFSSTFTSYKTQSEILAEKLLEKVNCEQMRIRAECKALKGQLCNFYCYIKKMISINFIFPNSENRIQKSYKGSLKVYQIKENLVCSSLPGHIEKNSIEYLRFFTMGKEMEDAKTLASFPIHDPTHPMPVHVHAVYSSTPKLNSNCCGYCEIA